jgi:predicted anti-sigma-YlaC factor YlaD
MSYRYALGVIAATEVVLGLGSLIGDVSLHPFRELAGADIAFAVGCLVAAVQPRRALGLLPVAVALAALIIGTGALDLVRGVTGPLSESHHLLELVGTATLVLLARQLGATRDLA